MPIINPTIKNVKRPPYYVAKTKDANNILQKGSEIIDLTGVTGLGDRVLQNAYLNNTSISGIFNAPDLTTISGNRCCYFAFKGSGVTGVNLSKLKTVTGIAALYETFMDCTGITGLIDLGSLETIDGDWNCTRTFSGFSGITSVNLVSLKTINGANAANGMFDNSGITGSIDLSSLKTINGNYASANMFANSLITGTVDLDSLETITGDYAGYLMFFNCTGVTNVKLNSLKTISGSYASTNMVNNTSITTCSFPSLTKITGTYAMGAFFNSCTHLNSVYFPALTSTSFDNYTNVFTSLLYNCSNVTVHFPSNLQSVIGSWSDVTSGFGGTNTTVLFDLPATE